jgi:glycosyltransferase involved in cell wall biosynthesis
MFATLARHRETNRELIFVSNPPFFPIAGWLLCRLKGWDYTYVIYDLYPEIIVESGHIEPNGIVHRTWAKLNEYVLGDANNVVALGPVMRDRIIEVAGEEFDEEAVTIIHNWEDESFIQPIDKAENPFSEEYGLCDAFALVYSGNIGSNHDLETVVRAAAEFESEAVKVLIIGEGDAKADVVSLSKRLGLGDDTVEFLPYQPRDTFPYSLTSGDVSVVAVSEGMEGLCVSSKLYTSLAAGQPTLIVSHPEDDEARIIDSQDAGIQVAQKDIEGLVAAIQRWRSNPQLVERQGRNARQSFEDHFTKNESIDMYYRLLVADDQTSDRN